VSAGNKAPANAQSDLDELVSLSQKLLDLSNRPGWDESERKRIRSAAPEVSAEANAIRSGRLSRDRFAT